MGILELLTQLLQFIREVIWPFWIVAAPNRAVRYRFGRPKGTLEPDWYFAWPWAEEIRQTNCAEDTIDIANISGTSKDGVQFTASFNLRLKVIDPLLFQLNLRQELDPKKADTMPAAIHAECTRAIAAMFRNREWKAIYRSQGKIGAKLTRTVKTLLTNWGVEVLAGGITICSQAIPLAIINVE